MMRKDIQKFCDFLDYYSEKYAKKASEISLTHPTEGPGRPLVSSDFIMLDFDGMCRDAEFYPKRNWRECNQPSTVDALYYRVLDDDNVEFSLVEFKTVNFNLDLKADFEYLLDKIERRISQGYIDSELQHAFDKFDFIKPKFGNTLEFALRIKPYESLFVVLPKLYEEYCAKNNISEDLDLYSFFKSDVCTIKLFVVGKKYGDNLSKAYLGKMGHLLEKQYQRLDFVNVLTKHPQRLCFNDEFDYYAQNLRKVECENIRSLNNHM